MTTPTSSTPTERPETFSVETASSNYTHVVCGRCGELCYCSEAKRRSWGPGTGFGWCEHILGRLHRTDATIVGGPTATCTEWPSDQSYHRCNGEMRNLAGDLDPEPTDG